MTGATPVMMIQYSASGRLIRRAPVNATLQSVWQRQVPFGRIVLQKEGDDAGKAKSRGYRPTYAVCASGRGVSLKLDDATWEALDALAKARNVSRAALAQDLLADGLRAAAAPQADSTEDEAAQANARVRKQIGAA